MANKQRGEVSLKIGAKTYTGTLTLGALAHLEDVLNIDKPGELDRVIAFPTYNQLAMLTHAILNFRKPQEVISLDDILAADVSWPDCYEAILAAVARSNPKAAEGKDEKEEAPPT